MSSLEARLATPVVGEEMAAALRGLGLLLKLYGDKGLQRLRKRVNRLNIRSEYDCAMAIASGLPYNVACERTAGLESLEMRAYYGFTTTFSGMNNARLTTCWQALIRTQ